MTTPALQQQSRGRRIFNFFLWALGIRLVNDSKAQARLQAL